MDRTPLLKPSYLPSISTSDADGSDLDIRQNWMPLFYKYGVDDVYQTGTAGEPTETINVSGTQTETEDAPWSAVTDPNTAYPWGVGVFDVDPGRFPGDKTTMTFTYYHTPAATASAPYPAPVEFDTFTATRTRSDGFGFRQRDAK